MRKLHLILILSALSFAAFSQKNTREEYIVEYQKIAIREMQSYGIPASITIAQGILESSDGNGYLATEANNHFGIKCHDWDGPSVKKDDDAKDECFRKYFDAEESFEDHSIFLTTRSRYAFLFDYKSDNYKAWAKGLKKAGYATDPKYPNKLIKIIEDNRLYLLDEYALAKRPKEEDLPITIANTDEEIIAEALRNGKGNPNYKTISDEILVSDNGLQYIVYQDDRTLKEIANDNNLHLWEIHNYNDIEKSAKKPEKGQRLYLQNKNFKVRKGKLTHKVIPNETMLEISQMHGIRLKSLYKINDMGEGTQPQAGDILLLNKKAKTK